ncbi:MAG: hypothetical protein JOY54_10210 [Acidobacteriaceae bacterium]|nr:hypothetical protein [Acidobacteriaceae bacterium]
MCDYSLAALRTRLAVESEQLIVYRFPTGTLGLTSPTELEAGKHELSGWRSRLNARQVPCAVCIPPGARLMLHDIPDRLRRQLGVGAVEEVVFTQISAMPGRHRDSVQFKNKQEILLQQLAEGQRVEVLCLSLPETSEEEVEIPDHSMLV